MSVQMSVKISDITYERLKKVAHAQQEPLGETVERLLDQSLPSSEDEIEEVLDESEKALKRELLLII